MSAELSVYNLEKKEYSKKSFSRPCELVNITGNVAPVDNRPFVHVHAAISNEGFEVFGGHVVNAVVGPTCEIFLSTVDKDIKRKYDDEIGLNLLDL